LSQGTRSCIKLHNGHAIFLLLIAKGEVIICVEIVHKVLGFLVGDIINSVVSEEGDNLLGRDEFVARTPVEPLECNVGAADEGALVLVELSEALSELLTLQLPSGQLEQHIS
jgi:hypothetical protein